MTAEYRFLRFEIAGIITLVFYIFMTWPLVAALMKTTFMQKFDFSLAVVVALFLISLPLGYWEHQLVVNKYRSEKRGRKAFKVLRDMILQDQQIKASFPGDKNFFQYLNPREESSFLTALIELCIYSDQTKLESGFFERLSDRWSHFYARKAKAVYAPIFSAVFWVITILFGYLFQWPIEFEKIWLSILIGAGVFGVNFILIDPYSTKIWSEINFFEAEAILANKNEIMPILSSLVKQENLEYLTGVG